MANEVEEFRSRFNDVAADCQRFCFVTRGIEFIEKAVEKMREIGTQAEVVRVAAISNQNEDLANAMLSFREMSLAMECELQMWVEIKQDSPNDAWERLQDAQMAARHAMQAHAAAHHLEGYVRRLLALEQIIFPQQCFCSVGATATKITCSICARDYVECGHVKGKPYMGELCCAIIEDPTLREISIVMDPASKRHRMTSFSEGGIMRDVMSWRTVPSREEGDSPENNPPMTESDQAE